MQLEITATHLVEAHPRPRGLGVVVSEGPIAMVLHGAMGQGGGPIVEALAERAWRESLEASRTERARGRLERGFQAIRAAFVQHQREHPEHGMIFAGLAAIALDGTDVWLGHVGLPRIYRLRGADLQRLTEDHTPPGMPFAARYVLSGDEERSTMPALRQVPVAVGDRFLLATDELFRAVPEARLASAFDRFAEVVGDTACAAAIATVMH